jgi:DNA-binding FadR family transcriptional regulator
MLLEHNNSEALLKYLIEEEIEPGERLPSLIDLSQELGFSVGKLREELELARNLGFVSVRPRHGIRREKFDFHPAVQTSLLFGLASGEATFEQFSLLRRTIETNMWHLAVTGLTIEDTDHLFEIVAAAWKKLQGSQVF